MAAERLGEIAHEVSEDVAYFLERRMVDVQAEDVFVAIMLGNAKPRGDEQTWMVVLRPSSGA